MSTLSSARIEPTTDQIERVALRLLSLLPGIYRTMDDALALQASPPPASGLRRPLRATLSGPLPPPSSGCSPRSCAGSRGRSRRSTTITSSSARVAGCAAAPRRALLGVQLPRRRSAHQPRRGRAQRGLAAARKGTPATLEEMLSVTTGWAVDAHEGFKSLMVTQDLNNVVPSRGVLVDVRNPIPLADPISRRTGVAGPPGTTPPALAVLPGESVDDALRRLGRIDAGQPAVSPRTLDLLGWARPEAVLVRTAQLIAVELEDMPCFENPVAADGRRVIALDPLGRPTPLVWLEPAEGAGAPRRAHRRARARHRASRARAPQRFAADPDRARGRSGRRRGGRGARAIDRRRSPDRAGPGPRFGRAARVRAVRAGAAPPLRRPRPPRRRRRPPAGALRAAVGPGRDRSGGRRAALASAEATPGVAGAGHGHGGERRRRGERRDRPADHAQGRRRPRQPAPAGHRAGRAGLDGVLHGAALGPTSRQRDVGHHRGRTRWWCGPSRPSAPPRCRSACSTRPARSRGAPCSSREGPSPSTASPPRPTAARTAARSIW